MTANLDLHCSHVTNAVFFSRHVLYERICTLRADFHRQDSNTIYTEHGPLSLNALAAIRMWVLLYPCKWGRAGGGGG